MKWLKYQHKHSSGRSAWQWRPISDDATSEDVEEIVSELAEEYSYSDKYSGIDYDVVAKPYRWVLLQQYEAARERCDAARRSLQEFTSLILEGAFEECPQCEHATAATVDHYREHGTGTEIKPCPTCGRDVLVSTVPFWLMPSDTAAVKLLGSLVEQGERRVKSRSMRWPVEDDIEDAAFSRLVKLGLAGGSSQYNVREIHATDRGKAEWQKHKERQA